MTLPSLTLEQRRAALAKAAAARLVRADVKTRLKSAQVDLAEVLQDAATDEAVAKLRVVDLLQAMPGVGAVRADEIMQRLGIAPSRRLRGLGPKQQAALLTEFADRGGVQHG